MSQAPLRINYEKIKQKIMELAEIDPLLAVLATAGLAAITTFHAMLACLACGKEEDGDVRELAYNN